MCRSFFFFSSRRRHTRSKRDWSSDVCSSDLLGGALLAPAALSLLMTMFTEGRERNLALGIYGAASGSGAAAGVLLGGEIGRASCRERVEVSVVAGAAEKKAQSNRGRRGRCAT